MISESRLTLHTISLRYAVPDSKFGVRNEDAMIHAIDRIPGLFSPDDSDQGPRFELYQPDFDEFTSLDGEPNGDESILVLSFSSGQLLHINDIIDATAAVSRVVAETAPMLRYIRTTETRTYEHTESVNLPF